MTIVIRSANDSDIQWLTDQMIEFSKFQGTKISLFSTPEFVKIGLKNLIDNHFFKIACGCNDGIIERMGFIAGILMPHPYNPRIRIFAEQFWWVEPKFRNSRAGLLLLNEFMGFGEKNADWVTFTIESKSPVSEKTLTRRGFQIQELSYLKEVV